MSKPTLLEGLTPAQRALRENPAPTPTPVQKALDDRFDALCGLIAQVMVDDRGEPTETAGRYAQMLAEIAEDQTYEGVTYLGLVRAPAAVTRHHAHEGGLIEHLLQMWDAWLTVRGHGAKGGAFPVLAPPHITDARVLAHILNHDLHKGIATYVLDEAAYEQGEWRVSQGKHISDQLLNPTLKTLWLLGQAEIALDIEQMHALAQAEGGWSDQTGIKHTSVLAKIGYILDEMSANVLDRIGHGFLLESGKPARTDYLVPPQAQDAPYCVQVASPDKPPLYLARWIDGNTEWHPEQQRALPFSKPEAQDMLASIPGVPDGEISIIPL